MSRWSKIKAGIKTAAQKGASEIKKYEANTPNRLRKERDNLRLKTQVANERKRYQATMGGGSGLSIGVSSIGIGSTSSSKPKTRKRKKRTKKGSRKGKKVVIYV